MKIPLLLFFLMLKITISFGQIEIQNLSIKDPTIKLVFSGQENRIILLNTRRKKNYELVSSDKEGLVVKISQNEFIIKPSYSCSMDTLRIIENGIEIRADYFKVSRTPVPFVQFSTIHYETKYSTVDRILSHPFLEIIYEGLFFREDEISGFDLTLFNPEKKLIYSSLDCIGNQLTTEHCQVIRSLTAGCTITISNIKSKDPAGIIRSLTGFTLEIE